MVNFYIVNALGQNLANSESSPIVRFKISWKVNKFLRRQQFINPLGHKTILRWNKCHIESYGTCTQLTAISFCLSLHKIAICSTCYHLLRLPCTFHEIFLLDSFINCVNIWIYFSHWLCKCIVRSKNTAD